MGAAREQTSRIAAARIGFASAQGFQEAVGACRKMAKKKDKKKEKKKKKGKNDPIEVGFPRGGARQRLPA